MATALEAASDSETESTESSDAHAEPPPRWIPPLTYAGVGVFLGSSVTGAIAGTSWSLPALITPIYGPMSVAVTGLRSKWGVGPITPLADLLLIEFAAVEAAGLIVTLVGAASWLHWKVVHPGKAPPSNRNAWSVNIGVGLRFVGVVLRGA